ncbi:uncharacterized protein BDZ83DRAFT_461262 [Colletotrichum acutatum]|uniref:Uncharacterized protein n=1 Tax=Glomerella acutata TaxID=27357 RepID=A0AAD8UCB3_GLOAC|nr:uncharacterized protein BDZ83DRAFT_461262 [Colletotrichum acutatum]KAK1719473.1 hypothetical protein BDZ83DRAFT_461262 [Colletotrichum acutatum]
MGMGRSNVVAWVSVRTFRSLSLLVGVGGEEGWCVGVDAWMRGCVVVFGLGERMAVVRVRWATGRRRDWIDCVEVRLLR